VIGWENNALKTSRYVEPYSESIETVKLLNFYIVFGTVMLGLTSVFMILEGNKIYWTQLLWIGFVVYGFRQIRMEHLKNKK